MLILFTVLKCSLSSAIDVLDCVLFSFPEERGYRKCVLHNFLVLASKVPADFLSLTSSKIYLGPQLLTKVKQNHQRLQKIEKGVRDKYQRPGALDISFILPIGSWNPSASFTTERFDLSSVFLLTLENWGCDF